MFFLGVSEWATTVAIFCLRDSAMLVKGDWCSDTGAVEASSCHGNTSQRSMSGTVLPALPLARTARDMGLQRAMTLPDMWWVFGEQNIHYLSLQPPRRPWNEYVARVNVWNWEKDMTNVWPCVFLWAKVSGGLMCQLSQTHLIAFKEILTVLANSRLILHRIKMYPPEI